MHCDFGDSNDQRLVEEEKFKKMAGETLSAREFASYPGPRDESLGPQSSGR